MILKADFKIEANMKFKNYHHDEFFFKKWLFLIHKVRYFDFHWLFKLFLLLEFMQYSFVKNKILSQGTPGTPKDNVFVGITIEKGQSSAGKK